MFNLRWSHTSGRLSGQSHVVFVTNVVVRCDVLCVCRFEPDDVCTHSVLRLSLSHRWSILLRPHHNHTNGLEPLASRCHQPLVLLASCTSKPTGVVMVEASGTAPESQRKSGQPSYSNFVKRMMPASYRLATIGSGVCGAAPSSMSAYAPWEIIRTIL